jgi:hypothetical protein
MLRHLVSLLLVCVMVAGVLRPAMAVGHAEMSQGAGQASHHASVQHDLTSQGMGGCEGTHDPFKAMSNGACRHASADAMDKGCVAMSGGCFPPALEGVAPTALGALSQAPWSPWGSPARHLTAIPTDPAFRPPRVLS